MIRKFREYRQKRKEDHLKQVNRRAAGSSSTDYRSSTLDNKDSYEEYEPTHLMNRLEEESRGEMTMEVEEEDLIVEEMMNRVGKNLETTPLSEIVEDVVEEVTRMEEIEEERDRLREEKMKDEECLVDEEGNKSSSIPSSENGKKTSENTPTEKKGVFNRMKNFLTAGVGNTDRDERREMRKQKLRKVVQNVAKSKAANRIMKSVDEKVLEELKYILIEIRYLIKPFAYISMACIIYVCIRTNIYLRVVLGSFLGVILVLLVLEVLSYFAIFKEV